MVRMVLILLLVGGKTGASLLSQSLSVATESRNYFRQSFENCSKNDDEKKLSQGCDLYCFLFAGLLGSPYYGTPEEIWTKTRGERRKGKNGKNVSVAWAKDKTDHPYGCLYARWEQQLWQCCNNPGAIIDGYVQRAIMSTAISIYVVGSKLEAYATWTERRYG